MRKQVLTKTIGGQLWGYVATRYTKKEAHAVVVRLKPYGSNARVFKGKDEGNKTVYRVYCH